MTYYNFPNKVAPGFTVIEVIIVLGIVALMATIASISFIQRDPDTVAESAMVKFRSSLNLARSYTTTGQSCCGGQTTYGYGVHFRTDQPTNGEYIVYANTDQDSFEYVNGEDEIIQTGYLEGQVNFVECWTGVHTTTPSGYCDVLFSSSRENPLYINGAGYGSPDNLYIDAVHVNSTLPARVEIIPASLVIQ